MAKGKEKRHNIPKTVSSAVFVCAFTGLLVFGARSQRLSLGQSYRVISVNGEILGATAEKLDLWTEIRQARMAAAESHPGIRLLWQENCEEIESNRPFTELLSASEIKERIKETVENLFLDQNRLSSVTVKVGDFEASFPAKAEALAFLDEAKAGKDPESAFYTVITEHRSTENGCLFAALEKKDSENTLPEEAEEPEENASAAKGGRSGVIPAFLNVSERPEKVSYVAAGVCQSLYEEFSEIEEDPFRNRYEEGLVDMDFAVPVYLYTESAAITGFSDPTLAVQEVTKEEEKNKIYVVKPGDTMSEIAEDYGLSLDYLLKLNSITDGGGNIHIDQELIVAVPEPELKIRTVEGILYKEPFSAKPVIIPNNDWYNTREEVITPGSMGLREVNAFVTYENGLETSRYLAHTKVLQESVAEVIERGTIVPPTYIKPLSGGRFTSGFGQRWGRMHKGVDWACPTGTVVYASSDGVVEYAGWGNGYGNTVLLSHPDGRKTRVAHLSKILVSQGQAVSQGQTLGLSGSTGRSTGPHVHFEIYINGTQVNPLDYIN